MGKKKILFVCSANLHRSPTAEAVIDKSRYDAKSAGISPFSANPVSREMLEWADIIFVMDEKYEGQKTFLLRNFQTKDLEKKIIVLGIPDIYEFMSPGLIGLLKDKLKNYL